MVTVEIGGGVDWGVLTALVGALGGVILGFGLTEISTQRRARLTRVRAARALAGDLEVARARAVQAFSVTPPRRDLLVQRIEGHHGLNFTDAVDLLPRDDRTAVGGICSGYEFAVDAGTEIRVPHLIACIATLDAYADLWECRRWSFRKRHSARGAIRTARSQLDVFFPGRPR